MSAYAFLPEMQIIRRSQTISQDKSQKKYLNYCDSLQVIKMACED